MADLMIRRVSALLDPFLLLLMATVALATILPARGAWAPVVAGLADAGIVLLFFLHGARLSREAIVAGARKWHLHLAVLLTTFALFPLLGLAFGALPFLPGEFAAGMLFLTLLPSTVQSSIAFTAIARGDVAAAVCAASFSNLAGIFLTPALVALLMGGTMGGFSWGAAQTILLQLLLPFLAGHLLRPWIGDFVARHKAWLGKVDRGSILLVVYAAFGAAVVEGLWQKVAPASLLVLAALCTALLAIVLGLTWWLGRSLGLAREEAIVLLFCGSKKSLASGVPMAGVLFPAASVGIVLLPIMIFHQLQLMACAVIAPRLGAAAPEQDGA